jgi:hypothetical protein
VWGKKKKQGSFAESATAMIIQANESMAANGLLAQHLAATDGMLHSYWGQGIDWFAVWAAQAERLGFNEIPSLLLPPYWAPGPDERVLSVNTPLRLKPASVLAFLPVPNRKSIAMDDAAGRSALEMLKYDPAELVRSAARANLARRGYIYSPSEVADMEALVRNGFRRP